MHPRHAHALLAVLAVFAVLLPYQYLTDPIIVTAGHDMTNLIPASLAYQDPELFSKDVFFQMFVDFYPKPFLAMYSFLVGLSGDFVFVNYLISSLCFLAFVLGVYWLVQSQFNRTVGLVAALLSVAVRPALAVKYGINLGFAMPRYLLLAASPWLIWYVLKNKEKKGAWIIVFFVIGLFANVHPLSAGHLALVLVGVLLLSSSSWKRKIVQSTSAMGLFLAGALPFILQKLSYVNTGDIAPRALILERAWFILPPYPRNFGNYGLFFLQIAPFVIAAYFGYKYAKQEQKQFMHLAYASIAVSALSLIEYVWPKIVTLEFMRASAWLYLPLMAFTAVVIVKLYATTWKKSAVLLFLALAIPPLVLIPLQTTAMSAYGELTGQRPFEFDYQGLDEFQESILDVAEFLKTTPKDTLVLVPPRAFAHLRTYGLRSLVVTHKDANIHSAEHALLWNATYAEVETAYKNNEGIEEVAKKYGADLILIDKKTNRLDLPAVYENERFILSAPVP